MDLALYDDFFTAVLENDRTAMPYQRRLAEGPWPDCLIVPTGLGKTAAVILAWLYKRLRGDSGTPRRLVYCLPMRVLVEQTARTAADWTNICRQHFVERNLTTPVVYVLMGGASDDAWLSAPEQPAIIIGTQDMLLSRALMRGYGMSRYRWPVDFAFLHNDALWVFDEIQLMGVGLNTSAQLEAFRRMEEPGTALSSRTLWMSATLDRRWLGTVDFRPHLPALVVEELRDDDLGEPEVDKRTGASKVVARAGVTLTPDNMKGVASYPTALANAILAAHRPGKTTLVIVNRVDRAQAIFRHLQSQLGETGTELVLIHSRFRPTERRHQESRLSAKAGQPGRIVVATQAIEAGVDVTSAVLFTELAPWTSLVQRFGRCNRYGELNEDGGGRIFWIDIAADADPLPYEAEDLELARTRIASLDDARPRNLPNVEEQAPLGQVLRRKDFIELFNTDPDLSGFDVDVSPFVRDADDVDVHVFWREFEKAPEPDADRPQPRELCPVSIARFRDFFGRMSRKGTRAFVWDPLGGTGGGARAGRWVPLAQDRIYPGLEIMLPAHAGGYDPALGFLAHSTSRVEPAACDEPDQKPEGADDDGASQLGAFVSLTRHAAHAEEKAAALCAALDLRPGRDAVLHAARWHDVGKGHKVFQGVLTDCVRQGRPKPANVLLAKSACTKACKDHGCGSTRYDRPGFRHELGSALAWLAHGDGPDKDLTAYLIAVHHGKVRMGLRALPIEREPDGPQEGGRFARGIWDGDLLPEVDLGNGTTVPSTELSLALMELGGGDSAEESWTARTQRLLAEHGPFRLAFLEALVRLADWRASAGEEKAAVDDL